MTQIETERKFLIKMPEHLERFEHVELAQTYLTGFVGTARVREWRQNGSVKYIFTEKQRKNALSALERETEISETQAKVLLSRADPARKTVQKTRYFYPYGGHTFEMDVYPFWKGQCIMEVELKSEAEDFILPPDITVLREVTEDKRYKNVMLAQCVPEEEK